MKKPNNIKKNILCIAGTRPEIIKMAPIVKALRRTEWAAVTLVASGQHKELAHSAFASFGLVPDLDLTVMTENQTLSSLTARLYLILEPTLKDLSPDLVIAQGDTTTVMTVATVCFYLNIPFVHVEAGLRTGNLRDPFPEEFNRLVCGHLAHLHCAPTQSARQNLINEGIADHSILLSGNTVIDALLTTAGNEPNGLDPTKKLIVMTAHRRENFGEPLKNVFLAIRDLLLARTDVQLLYPVHPNPNVTMMAANLFSDINNAHLCQPLGYEAFIGAMRKAYLIVSDSGGVQEEAPALSKPVLVIRNETERPEAVESGAAKLIGTDYKNVRRSITELLDDPALYATMAIGLSPYGDGLASARIVDALEVSFALKPQRELAPFSPLAAITEAAE